jgi:mycothiol system anti-sigma-R factor
MTDCGCEKARAELEEYLHNELSRKELDDIVEHLANCGDCEGEHHVGVVLTEKVRRACKETAPADLRAQVLLKLHEAQTSR